jgi:hypothetical protein
MQNGFSLGWRSHERTQLSGIPPKGDNPMSIVDNAKDIYDLAKKGMTVELQEKVMQLREQALSLQEENLKLRRRIQELEEIVNKRNQIVFEQEMYWLKKDDGAKDGPFCAKCHDADGKMVRVNDGKETVSACDWICPVCFSKYGKRYSSDSGASSGLRRAIW